MSLRDMPEYKRLICDWSALLRALQGDERRTTTTSSSNKVDQRLDTVTKRVLLRMLVTSVQLEVSDSAAVATIVDPELTEARRAENESRQASTKRSKSAKKSSSTSSHEELTLALLRALPGLLTSFKSETLVLQGLCTLPQYFRTWNRLPL